MIGVMEDIAEYSMSYFDTAKNKGKHAPENFYHGLVLGLIVSMRKEYRIVSNRESGEADLLAYGIPADHIYKLGFGFLGKKVWVVSDPPEKDEKDQVRSEWDNLRFR